MVTTAKRSRAAAAPAPACEPAVPAPADSARSAGLRYVSDTSPGIRREAVRGGFRYVAPDGSALSDEEDLARIRSLAIPPAWTDVWICPRANGHLQATGRDARGRKQYRYHSAWRQVRDGAKYGRMIDFGRALPAIRRTTDEHLRRQGLPREKVLATVVKLLEATLIRVGNEEYARANESYGLTTMRDDHVEIAGAKITFQFRGKSGKDHNIEFRDRKLARIVKHLRDLDGQELFQYVGEGGVQQTIGSGDVNAYLREIAGSDFTAKDFRTWFGTVLAAAFLRTLGPADSKAQGKRIISRAVELVSERLGNTPAICRKCYVHPAVLEAYEDGEVIDVPRSAAASEGLEPEERALLKLLERRAA